MAAIQSHNFPEIHSPAHLWGPYTECLSPTIFLTVTDITQNKDDTSDYNNEYTQFAMARSRLG